MTQNIISQELQILQAENNELKSKLSVLEQQNNEASIILIDNAIKTGIIQIGARQAWIALANNFPNDCREA